MMYYVFASWPRNKNYFLLNYPHRQRKLWFEAAQKQIKKTCGPRSCNKLVIFFF